MTRGEEKSRSLTPLAEMKAESPPSQPESGAPGRQAKAYPVVCSSARPFAAQDELKPCPDEDESKFLS